MEAAQPKPSTTQNEKPISAVSTTSAADSNSIARTNPDAGTNGDARTNADARVNAHLSKVLRTTATVFAAIVSVIGATAIIGWIIAKDTFLLSSGAAVELLLWSSAYLLFIARKSLPLRLIAYGAVAVVGMTALLNIISTTLDFDLGMLTSPIIESGDSPLNFPGPILPDIATSFLMLSIATIAMFSKSTKWPSFHKILAVVLLFPNLVIVGSSMAGLQSICTYLGCVKPSLFASTSFIFAGLAIIFAYPDEGITAPFTYNTASGRLMRSIFLCLTPIIPIFGLLSYGQSHGLYDQTISYGMMVVAIVALFICGIAWGVKKVEVIEAEKTVALQLLQESIQSFVPSADTTYKLVCLECGKEFDDSNIAYCPTDGSELGKLADKLKIGSVFADRYEITSFIGSGGCSIIYEAKHMMMNKQVALKLLRANFATETKFVQRFQRESKATSQLMHPNIVVVHDFGISLGGQPYIVMDYLKGMSLGDRIERAGALPWRQAVPILIDICQGLQYAHQMGVFHRDLKPANIMLVDEGAGTSLKVKIVDFGLAKTSDAGDLQLTGTGELLGSPTYMSPEQCKGDPVDNRTDIYSFGSLVYHTLTGKPAIETGNIYEAMNLQVSEPPAPFHYNLDIPDWLAAVVFKALEKDPAYRQQSVDEILAELQAGIAEPSILGYSSSRRIDA